MNLCDIPHRCAETYFSPVTSRIVQEESTIANCELLNRQNLLVDALFEDQEVGLGPNKSRVKKIKNLPPPASLKKVRVTFCQQKHKIQGQTTVPRCQQENKQPHHTQIEEILPTNVEKMKHELASIRYEIEMRDQFLIALQEECDEIQSELDSAKTAELDATAHAQQMTNDVRKLRKQLDRYLEKIPKLRKKVEKRYKKAAKLQLKVVLIDKTNKDYHRNLKKLKQLRRLYDPFCEEFDQNHKDSSEEMEATIESKRQKRHGTTLTNLTHAEINEIVSSEDEDEYEDIANCPRLERRHWKNLTRWTNTRTLFQSAALLSNDESDSISTFREEGSHNDAPKMSLNKCSSMPNLHGSCDIQDKPPRISTRVSSSSDFRNIVNTMTLS